MCNSRVVQPVQAGQAPGWPLMLLWGGLVAAVAAGGLFWLARRRRRRSALPPIPDQLWQPTFMDEPDAQSHGAEQPELQPPVEAETLQRR
jgi:hypothetical protein